MKHRIRRSRKKPEVAWKRGLGALGRNKMAAVKYNLAICKQKNTKNSHKTCAAALCNNRSENRPELIYHNFPSDSETSKKWEVRMRRGDEYFKRVENRYCCSEHFVPSDYRRSLTGHRMDLKKGSYSFCISLVSGQNKY